MRIYAVGEHYTYGFVLDKIFLDINRAIDYSQWDDRFIIKEYYTCDENTDGELLKDRIWVGCKYILQEKYGVQELEDFEISFHIDEYDEERDDIYIKNTELGVIKHYIFFNREIIKLEDQENIRLKYLDIGRDIMAYIKQLTNEGLSEYEIGKLLKNKRIGDRV